MYALAVTLTLAAGLFAAQALPADKSLVATWSFSGFGAMDTAALWFVLTVNTAWLISLKPRWETRRFWPWIAAQLLAVVPFLPWRPTFVHQFSGGFAGWNRRLHSRFWLER